MDFDERVDATTAVLRANCETREVWVSPADMVAPETAADILGVSVGTLGNWRSQAIGPPYHRNGPRGRVLYHLVDLAAELVAQRVDCSTKCNEARAGELANSSTPPRR